jgi:RecB family exonuclease
METKTKPKTKTKKIKKRWLSPTSINMYMRCPRRFYLSYVRKLKTKPNIHLLRGSAVHKTLERFFSEGYADSSETVYYDQLRGAILCLFNDEWRSRKDSFIALDLKEDDIAFYFQDSQKMIINWLHSYLKSGEPPADPSETEAKIFSSTWRTMAIIDRIVNNKDPPKIRDYKTSKSCEITDENRRQMGICTLLYEDKFGTKPDAEIHYLKFQDGLKDVKLTDDYMEDLKQLIIDIHHKTMSEKEEDYPCKCNGWCDKEYGIA